MWSLVPLSYSLVLFDSCKATDNCVKKDGEAIVISYGMRAAMSFVHLPNEQKVVRKNLPLEKWGRTLEVAGVLMLPDMTMPVPFLFSLSALQSRFPLFFSSGVPQVHDNSNSIPSTMVFKSRATYYLHLTAHHDDRNPRPVPYPHFLK